MDDKKDYPNLKNGVKFTSENQPTPKAKSIAAKKSWEYRKALQQFFENMGDIQLADGSKMDFWDAVKNKLHELLFDKQSRLNEAEKSELMLKLIKELMPKDSNVKVDLEKPIICQFDKEDKDL